MGTKTSEVKRVKTTATVNGKQKDLLKQIMKLTPEQIEALPSEQKKQVLLLREQYKK